ncbi:MAG: hypothetical protein K5761_07465 [Clostridiales bacterium]|nr:hypothetical protein [Clostridiales bacterium]
MKKATKEFNVKLYAIIVFAVMAVALFVIVFTTFTSSYTAFDPEKVAVGFVDGIARDGDGYDAYKVTLMSKNYKYGDFIREHYMYPLIYAEAGYKPGDSTDKLKGLNDESYMSEKSKNDDGTLEGKLIDRMYETYVQTLGTVGWDNYDGFFTEYFNVLLEKRKEIYGDEYITDEIMFTVLEANVKRYSEMLNGTEEKYDENTGVKISEEKKGIYQTKFGDDCVIEVKAIKTKDLNLENYKSGADKEMLETYKVNVDDISEAKTVRVTSQYGDEGISVTIDVTVVKIGNSWYVDNNMTKTLELYKAAEIGE